MAMLYLQQLLIWPACD